MLSNSKKGSPDHELLRAIITMSKDFLSRTFDLLQAAGVKETAKIGPAKQYSYNSEVKNVLRSQFSHLSESILQTMAPTSAMNGWERVLPNLDWFSQIREHACRKSRSIRQ